MGKEVELIFTVTVGMPFWRLGEHAPLIIDFPSCCISQEFEGILKMK